MSSIAFIGSAGIPNRYGGFEDFAEHCAPEMVAQGHDVMVTCDASLYEDQNARFRGVQRLFVKVPANGVWSIIHDAVAFCRVFRMADAIVVLGVSGGPWFPLFRLACAATGKRLCVNIDGVEWRRAKFKPTVRLALWLFDRAAQWSAHSVVYDNAALSPYVAWGCHSKATCIAYPGDHVARIPGVVREPGTALTVCRIEPENNLEMLIEGALASRLKRYTVVGNWSRSDYGRELARRYANEPRLSLRDPVYDPQSLAEIREQASLYLHGHSVGGTNPSLVEMLYYDATILCLDVAFNRQTAVDDASYFRNSGELAALINEALEGALPPRREQRLRYQASTIVGQYLGAALGFKPR